LIARLLHAIGLLEDRGNFPLLVGDRFGAGECILQADLDRRFRGQAIRALRRPRGRSAVVPKRGASRTVEKRLLELSGNSALFTKDRYFDPQDATTWMDEILFVKRNDTLYRLELECRSDQVANFEPVFTHLVSTFEFDCAAQ